MHLQAAKLPARVDAEGDFNPLVEQDRSRWDAQLVEQGLGLLDRSASGPVISAYHVEAAIAAVHAMAPGVDETKWDKIVRLYDRLMAIAPSPIVALNRAIAIAQRDGPEPGIDALRAISEPERMRSYPFYPAAFGELELRRRNFDAARGHFASAIHLARKDAERRFLERRIRHCDELETESAVSAYSRNQERHQRCRTAENRCYRRK